MGAITRIKREARAEWKIPLDKRYQIKHLHSCPKGETAFDVAGEHRVDHRRKLEPVHGMGHYLNEARLVPIAYKP